MIKFKLLYVFLYYKNIKISDKLSKINFNNCDWVTYYFIDKVLLKKYNQLNYQYVKDQVSKRQFKKCSMCRDKLYSGGLLILDFKLKLYHICARCVYTPYNLNEYIFIF